MRPFKKRAVALVLAMLTAICAVSCRSHSGDVFAIGEKTVDEGEYRFLVSTFKAKYLRTYTDMYDTADFWQGEFSGGGTNEAHVSRMIRDDVMTYLCAWAIFDDLGLKVDDSTLESIDGYINDLINDRDGGSRDAFVAELAEFGIGMEAFRTYIINDEKANLLYEHYFGSEGVRKLTEDDRESYYRANYVRFAQINVNDAFTYVEQDGAYVQDENGVYKTRALTADEKAEKQKLIDEIDKALAAGGDVEALYDKYSENKDYPNGYYFTHENASDYDPELVEAAFALKEGEWTKYVSAAYGTFYIKRLFPDRGGYAKAENADFFPEFDQTVSTRIFNDILTAKFSEVTVDEELFSAVSVAQAKPNYYLY